MFLQKMKNHDGFTLVELIVVIAIMAILAGVAVPAYSGYIEKADAAADSVLLDAVNDAFVAAVIENGGVPQQLNGASASISSGSVTGVSASGEGLDSTKVSASFATYFAGNERATFKSITALGFDKAQGIFVDIARAKGEVMLKYGDTYVTISGEDAQNLSNSTYGDVLGAQGLLDKVNAVAGFASALNNSESYNKVITERSFMETMLLNLGITDKATIDSMDTETLTLGYKEVLGELAIQRRDNLLKQQGKDLNSLTVEEKEALLAKSRAEVEAHVAVLHAAKNTSSMSETDTKKLLNSDTPKADMLATLNKDSGAGLSQAALYYGMYTSFANSKEYGNKDRQDAADNPITLITNLEGDELEAFQKYVNSEQGTADLNAYISSMNMINSSTSNQDAVSDVLINGYNNDQLVELLAGVIGK